MRFNRNRRKLQLGVAAQKAKLERNKSLANAANVRSHVVVGASTYVVNVAFTYAVTARDSVRAALLSCVVKVSVHASARLITDFD